MTTFFAHFSSDLVLYLQLSLGTCLHSCLATSRQFSLGTLWQLKLGTCWLLEPAGNGNSTANLATVLLGYLLAVFTWNLLHVSLGTCEQLFLGICWQFCRETCWQVSLGT